MWLEEDFLASLQKQDRQGEKKQGRRQRTPVGPHTNMGITLRTLENHVGDAQVRNKHGNDDPSAQKQTERRKWT